MMLQHVVVADMKNLVSCEWLVERLNQSATLAILDATRHLPDTGRDAANEFRAGHLPSAAYFDLASLIDSGSSVPAALPTRQQLRDRLQGLDINDGEFIVLYDDSAIKSSARAWFMLRLFGLESIAILDGGLAAWKAAGLPLETGDSRANASGTIELSASNGRVRTKSDMLANIDSGTEQSVDARDGPRFRGEVEDHVHNMPSGHIPHARNLPFGQVFTEDGTYKSLEDIRAAFTDAGIDPDQPIVTSCGSGMTASVLLFALHLIGNDSAALYDGSWSEWGADPTTPKATGSGN